MNGDGVCGFLAAYRQASGSSRLASFKGWHPSGAVLHSPYELGYSSNDSKT